MSSEKESPTAPSVPGHSRSSSKTTPSDLPREGVASSSDILSRESSFQRMNPFRNSITVHGSALPESQYAPTRLNFEEKPILRPLSMEQPKWNSFVPPDQLGIKILNQDAKDVCIEYVSS
jgi:hypothetical protein